MWDKYNFEHPALLGIYGLLPGDGVDTVIMKRTLRKVVAEWKFDTGWGWDGDGNIPSPGFPADGSWTVRWERLKKAP